MRLFLYGTSAAQWWACAKTRRSLSDVFGQEALCDCAPTAASIGHLKGEVPFLAQPFHVMVAERKDKRSFHDVVTHVTSHCYSAGSFVRIASGIYVSSPELCFIQLASMLCQHELVKHGYALCGGFADDPAESTDSQTSSRGLSSRAPITSVSSMRCYIEDNATLYGAQKASQALRWVRDGSASPRESDLAMRMMLPHRLGGYGLDGALLNHRIDLDARSRSRGFSSYYVADLCWPDAKLVIEYDSDLHLTSEQIAKDASKRRVLESMGYKVITVTKLQLDSITEMDGIAHVAARCIGKRIRPQSASYRDQQRRLFQMR